MRSIAKRLCKRVHRSCRSGDHIAVGLTVEEREAVGVWKDIAAPAKKSEWTRFFEKKHTRKKKKLLIALIFFSRGEVKKIHTCY
jgi:hypothetical protein